MEVKITKFDDEGQGIARINNKVCFVKRALPGETLDVAIIIEKKDYLKAQIKKIITPSKERKEPVCPYYNECGGCNFLHTTFKEEHNFKINKARDYFKRCDGMFRTLEYGYRDKVTLHVKNSKLGYYQEGSRELVSINYCYLLNPQINAIIKILNTYKDNDFNGSIIIRENKKGEVLLIINGKYQHIDKLKEENIITNIIVNDEVIKGKDYFQEEILDYKFKVHYNSFFQVNRDGLIKIIELLENYLKDKKVKKALDLYSGTSVLGIILSKYVDEVISIEENVNATMDAKTNLEINKITNLQVINGLVEDNIENFQDVDLILVDPARRGLDKKTIFYLNKIKAKYIIYISCEMISLKRDLNSLREEYELEKLYLVDMFPKTNKVETVMFLKSKS